MTETPRDSKDWTVVIEDGCDECGYVPHDPAWTSERLLALPERWERVLRTDDVRERPADGVWSPLEYACHSRDIVRLLRDRVALILNDQKTFDDFDGEREAVEGRYAEADPEIVVEELAELIESTVAVYGRVGETDWGRAGYRTDGRALTIADLSRYLLHDLEHHLADVEG
ncbi:DinB family protein [Flaviflexus equikiangi]|uniref:DinB family protein n=1 Tax=Flaviflexus equikiangi TaxID=2758573 RepID=UPI0015F654AD|nr:DinB family protein [Flaviflexus equikiangi]